MQPWYVALDLNELAPLLADAWNRVHQPRGIRMAWFVQNASQFANLSQTPRIHDDNPIGRLRNHSHIMGYEHYGGVMLATQPLQ